MKYLMAPASGGWNLVVHVLTVVVLGFHYINNLTLACPGKAKASRHFFIFWMLRILGWLENFSIAWFTGSRLSPDTLFKRKGFSGTSVPETADLNNVLNFSQISVSSVQIWSSSSIRTILLSLWHLSERNGFIFFQNFLNLKVILYQDFCRTFYAPFCINC